ncbi:MAG: 3-dehydroquinate synthase [Desulfuromonadales bacterium]|nr:3-dehydroquinate synthase [Desulfuromonadales bacterium]
MEQLTVGLGERSYPIWIGDTILTGLPEALRQIAFPKRIALVTNPVVGDLYAPALTEVLAGAGYRVSVIRLPDGEQYKTLDTLSLIYDELVALRFDRHTGLLALGGGVIGDMTGFAAATYLRGIPFVQVPTTLLSQVDSSVGGKTGVNHPRGKNLIGAFYQPRHVHIDVGVLQSLPDREYFAGLGEVVKYGIIRDQPFFVWLEEQQAALRDRETGALIHAVKRSCQIKADVVEEDEKEQGLRAILNLGHTFGHAIETLTGYGVIQHGEAVAIGMILAARTSCLMNLCTRADVARIEALLSGLHLPTAAPDFPADDYVAVMQHDKKVKSGTVRLVLNHGVGAAQLHDIDQPLPLMQQLLN